MIATTPQPPYYAVIFTNELNDAHDGYEDTAERMVELAQEQDGFLGFESARDTETGVTISYWRDLESIRSWKMNAEHVIAQQKGKSDWYSKYKTRICLVERDYGFSK